MSDTTESKADPATSEDVSLTDVTISVETTLVSMASAADPQAPPEAALEELKTEVLTAVRGAITGVMSRHQPALPEPDLDFDFHLREQPASEPEEAESDFQRALSQAVAAADPPAEDVTDPDDQHLVELEAPFFGDAASLAEEDAAPADDQGDEPRLLEPVTATAFVDVKPLSLIPGALPPVPVSEPLASPARRPWPAWTTAALLSLSGIAVGAGAATLLIEPAAFTALRDRLSNELGAALGTPAPEHVADAGDAATTVRARPAGTAPDTSTEIAGPTPAATMAKDSGGSTLEALDTSSNGAGSSSPDAGALADAVRVASAGEAAAFVHRLRKPLGAIALTSAGGAGSEALAALPPQATASPTPTGDETVPAPAALSSAPPLNEDVPVATADPVPAAAVEGEDSATPPAGAPPTAMARANAALGKGDVDTARLLLQAESEAGQVEGMLLLARTYDTSYLATLGIDAAKGKREVAERLYRAWYDRSVKLGLVSDGVNIDRLLRAMARAKP